MRSRIAQFLLLGFAAFTVVSCSDDTTPSNGRSNTVGPTIASIAAWPPPASGGKEVPLAKNLFAKNYDIVLDSSGSMSERACSANDTKSGAAKKAFAEFVGVVPQDANLGLVVFDSAGLREVVPIGAGNRSAVAGEINRTEPGGGTPLHDALKLSYARLEAQGRRQLGYGEYHLVVVTDGEANIGQDPGSIVNHIFAYSPVMIHTIGFCIGERHSLNQPGRTMYKAADNPQSLREGLKEVLAESPVFDVRVFESEKSSEKSK